MPEKSQAELIDEIRSLRMQLAAFESERNCWDRGVTTACVAQQRLAGILTISEDAIISADASHRITLFNQGAERIFQYKAEEVLGQPVHILLPERLRARHVDLINQFIAGEDASIRLGAERVIYGLRKDGTEFPVEASASRVTVDANVTLTVILRDVTERQRVESALSQARDQAVEASRIKSAFLANMSHEIRTPMNGIIGMIDLLMQTPLSDVQREYAHIIHDSAQSLLTLINDILDYSKIEANKLEMEIIDFEPLALVEGVAELLATKARSKGLSLMTYVDPAVPATLRGDPVRLRQILLNLGDNAIKFTKEGEVVIQATLAGAVDGTSIVNFSVRDTGIGIEPDLLNALFEPFVQADGSTTRRFGGTGLGLSISKRLVERMGGQIGVESEPGKGTHFWFRVPLELAALSPLGDDAVRDLSHVRVLVVDDSETACQILHSYLNSWGIPNTTTTRAEEALDRLREAAASGEPYDIAMIDLRMPRINGMDLAKWIRADASLYKTRLILVTAFESHGQGEQAVRYGFSAYMTKPVKQSHLFDCIVNLLHADRPISTSPMKRTNGRPSQAAPKGCSREARILVVEDNPVNRKVVTLQLESLGYEVEAVSTGSEAVKAVADSKYDLVLMDCQMPEMDGFQATQRIRKAEAITGTHIPIVALTANAMQGDRERCIGAGMDDYVSKPVSPSDLLTVLERWIGKGAKEPHPGQQATSPATGSSLEDEGSGEGSVVAVEELLATYGSDKGKVGRLLELYASSTAQTLQELVAAVESRNAKATKDAAHEMKGASNMVGAYPMGNRSLAVEQAVKTNDWKQVETDLRALLQTYRKTEAYISKLIQRWSKEVS